MAHINYIKLYNYFIEEEKLPCSAALRNIWRVGNLPKEFKSVVLEITEGRLCNVADFSIDGVTMKSLVDEEGMNFVQAVFFLDWLRREPANARSFMATRRLRTPIQEITDDERQNLLNALARAKQITGKDTPSVLVPEDNSGKDIDIETESEQVGVMTANIEMEHEEVSTEEVLQRGEEVVDQIKESSTDTKL